MLLKHPLQFRPLGWFGFMWRVKLFQLRIALTENKCMKATAQSKRNAIGSWPRVPLPIETKFTNAAAVIQMICKAIAKPCGEI